MRLVDAEDVRRIDLRFVSISDQVTRIALSGLWDLLGVNNQTEAVLKVKELQGEADNDMDQSRPGPGNPYRHGGDPTLSIGDLSE